MTRYLAPWPLLQKMETYHGDIKDEEAYKILREEKPGSYIMTRYDPSTKGTELTITRLSSQNPAKLIKTRALSFDWPEGPCWTCHPIMPRYTHKSHELSGCKFLEEFKYPIKRRNPPSLKELSRAKICMKLEHKDIQEMAEDGRITRDCRDFIMDRSSTHKPIKTLLFCDLYDN